MINRRLLFRSARGMLMLLILNSILKNWDSVYANGIAPQAGLNGS